MLKYTQIFMILISMAFRLRRYRSYQWGLSVYNYV